MPGDLTARKRIEELDQRLAKLEKLIQENQMISDALKHPQEAPIKELISDSVKNPQEGAIST